ncbi:Crossover junction endonuclease mus81 [Thoreauomyces humboldtii]|nr:Crossover junction endonuclease mus81 [Thoreauomyces humboldtii]
MQDSIRLPSGSFDIFCVVDTREVKFRKDRTYIQEQLEMQGVKTLTRALPIGDFMWIARSRNASDGNTETEVVLDYIIERKTTDDLVVSIKDSRFKDQKLRLMTCGIRHRIYLVEKSPSLARAIDFGMTAIRTAMTQVQIMNGFFLKQTASLDESIQYLVRMTKQVAALLIRKDLVGIPPQLVTKDTFKEQRELFEQQHGGALYITFSTFQSLNNKSKDYKLQDIWIRQLMTVKGVSGEKAAAFVKTFPTMRSLMDALEKCKDAGARETLVQNGGGNGRKAIGAALSKKILADFVAAVVSSRYAQ